MEWISIKDRLPDIDKRVLIYLSHGVIKVDERYKSLYGKQIGNWRYTYPETNITHWMPLPEPPKTNP